MGKPSHFSQMSMFMSFINLYLITCRIFCAKGITVSQIFCELLHFEMMVHVLLNIFLHFFFFLFFHFLSEFCLATLAGFSHRRSQISCFMGNFILFGDLGMDIFIYLSPFSVRQTLTMAMLHWRRFCSILIWIFINPKSSGKFTINSQVGEDR
jgi:hypothetical protein